MVAYKIDTFGLGKIVAKLRQTGDRSLVRVAFERYMRNGSATLRSLATTYSPKDTWALANSMQAKVTTVSATVSSFSAYARPVEEGRSAGAPMPSRGALQGWLMRHGIPASKEFVVARAISRRGIKGRFFMARALREFVNVYSPAALRAAASDVEAEWRMNGSGGGKD